MRLRIEVSDEHGTAAVFTDPPGLTSRQAGQVAELAAAAVTAVSALPGVNGPDQAREFLLAAAARQYADAEAYERVASLRGVLPL